MAGPDTDYFQSEETLQFILFHKNSENSKLQVRFYQWHFVHLILKNKYRIYNLRSDPFFIIYFYGIIHRPFDALITPRTLTFFFFLKTRVFHRQIVALFSCLNKVITFYWFIFNGRCLDCVSEGLFCLNGIFSCILRRTAEWL